MKRLQVKLLSCVVVAVVIPLLLTTGMAQAAASWSVVSSPNPGAGNNLLDSVAVVAANNVWAVGGTTASTGASHTLIEHWNGTTWSVVASPNVGAGSNILRAVSAVSASDVWAVGDFIDLNANDNTLTEHWNGTAWSVVASPNRVTGVNVLNAVQAASANDVWAVGQASPLSLIEHWNGTAWSVVASPSPNASLNFLFGAAADPRSGQTWAVGDVAGSTFFKTLIEFHP